jgi:DNA-binding transcriptional regulator/RsmH inhibitor MraZ
VSKRGEITLPPTFRRTARVRADSTTAFLLLDRHETDHCLVAADRLYHADAKTAHIVAADGDDTAVDIVARRRFGFAVEAELPMHGRMILPPLARALLGINDSVLMVATGHRFQIWDVEFVLEWGPADLVALVHLHLSVLHRAGDYHERLMSYRRPPHRVAGPAKPESGVRPMLPLSS